MHRTRVRWLLLIVVVVGAWAAATVHPPSAESACCYFAAKDKDILQPAQKAFVTWEPAEKVETFTVQPKFEGNALDFGMVIPTPARPKLDEMPRDFFKELAVFTISSNRWTSASTSPLIRAWPSARARWRKRRGGPRCACWRRGSWARWTTRSSRRTGPTT